MDSPTPNSTAPSAAPEMITFSCWSCATELKVPVSMAGVTGPCPCCGQVIGAPPPPHPTARPMPQPQSAEVKEVPPLRAPGSGYLRGATTPPPIPKPYKSKPTTLDHGWSSLPMVLMFIGGLVGGLVGALACAVNVKITSKMEKGPLRYFVTGMVTVSAVVLYVIVAVVAHLLFHPELMRDSVAQQAYSSNSGPSWRVDTFTAARKAIEARSPGYYTSADFAAAEAAAKGLGGKEAMEVYVSTLQDRKSKRMRM